MKLTQGELTAAHRLLSEHCEPDEDDALDPLAHEAYYEKPEGRDLFVAPDSPLYVFVAVVVGTLIVLGLLWVSGLAGMLIDAGR